MRILAISHNYPHKDDPVCGVFAARQFQQMHRLGHEMHIRVPLAYAPSWINRFDRYKLFRQRTLIPYEGVESEVFRYLRPPGKIGLLTDGPSAAMAARRKILQMHKTKPFDMIFARGFWLEANIGIRLSQKLDVPVTAIGIGTDVNVTPTLGDAFNKRFIWLCKNVDLAMATGKGVADQIEHIRGGDVPVIGGLVDLDVFKPVTDKEPLRKELGLPPDKIVILYVGHLIKTKGLYELLEAFRDIRTKRQDLSLVMCGDGTEKKPLEAWIDANGLAGDVFLPGNITPQDIHQWYQMSDIFAFPSYCEGMPNAVMEAMACGLPTISTQVGGLPEALKSCQGAILVKSRSSHELTKALLTVALDEKRRHSMSVAARQRALERFGIEQNVNRMVQYMENVKEEYACRR